MWCCSSTPRPATLLSFPSLLHSSQSVKLVCFFVALVSVLRFVKTRLDHRRPTSHQRVMQSVNSRERRKRLGKISTFADKCKKSCKTRKTRKHARCVAMGQWFLAYSMSQTSIICQSQYDYNSHIKIIMFNVYLSIFVVFCLDLFMYLYKIDFW